MENQQRKLSEKKQNYYKKRWQSMSKCHDEWHEVWNDCYYYASMIENYSTRVKNSPNTALENFDSFPVNGSEKVTGILKGMLFPSAGQSFVLKTTEKFKNNANVVKDVAWQSKSLIRMMDTPESRLDSAMFEGLHDITVGGTSGVWPRLRGKGLYYKAYGPNIIKIDTNTDGEVDAHGICIPTSNHELKRLYGEENLPDYILDELKNFKFEKTHDVVWLCETNKFRDPELTDNKNMPIASVHFIKKCGTIVKDSGFYELPIKIGRSKIRNNEKYGRSIILQCIMDIKNLARTGSIIIQGSEFSANPMVGYYNGSLGVDTVDVAPGQWLPVDGDKVPPGQRPTFPIFDVGDLNAALTLYNSLKEEISDNLMLDRLLDFNNQTQMTAQESRLRAAIRNQSNNGVFSMLLADYTTPVITASYNLAFEAGLLGVRENSEEHQQFMQEFPNEQPYFLSRDTYDAITSGQDIYRIDYITEASRIIKADKKQSLMGYLSFISQVVQLWPESAMILKGDKVLTSIADIDGIDEDLVRTQDEIDELKAVMQAQQQQQAMMQQRQEQAQTEVLENEAQNTAPTE